jgi:hypothetical protein
VAQVFFLTVLKDNGRLAFQGLEYLVFKRIIEKKKLTDIGLVGFFKDNWTGWFFRIGFSLVFLSDIGLIDYRSINF